MTIEEAFANFPSLSTNRLLFKPGFSYEGNLRQRYFLSDQFLDEYYFGLLKDEWHGPVHAYTP